MLQKIYHNPLLLTASLLTIAAVIVIFTLAVTSQPNLGDKDKVKVRIDRERITAVVAAKPETQAKGLGGSKALTDDEGMLFVYKSRHIPNFIMRDVSFPIDIIWIAGDTVTEVTPNVAPEPGVAEDQLKKYTPSGPIDRVLEVPAGFAERHGIQPGDPIKITAF